MRKKSFLILFLLFFITFSNPVFAQSDENWKNQPFRPLSSGNPTDSKRWVAGHFEVKNGNKVWVRGGYVQNDNQKKKKWKGGGKKPPWMILMESIKKSRKSRVKSSFSKSSNSGNLPAFNGKIPAINQTLSQEQTTGGNPHGWALVIGISKYKYSKNRFPELQYASKDAKAFYKFLCSPAGGGFSKKKVFYLEDEKATLINIKYAFFDFLKLAAKDDFIIIFFTGHSTPAENDPRNLYLLAYDSHPDYISSTAFPLWEIDTAFNRYIQSGRVIMLIDVCRSEGIFSPGTTRKIKKKNLVNKYLLQIGKNQQKRFVFTASEVGELSLESKKWGGGHGVFTYFLINGLRGEADLNDDNIVTLGETVDFVSENVRRATKDSQHPEIAGILDRGFSLATIVP